MSAIELDKGSLGSIEYTCKTKLLELHQQPDHLREEGKKMWSTDRGDFKAHAQLLRSVLKARRGEDMGEDGIYVRVWEMAEEEDEGFGE